MKNNRIRLAAISGATLALAVAGTAGVAAHGPRDDDRGFGPGMGGRIERGMADMGFMGGPMRGQMGAAFNDFERREVTLQTATGTTVQRVENGVVDVATDSSLEFSLGSGEVVSVTLADDTEIVAFSEETVERGGWSRQRMVPTEVAAADIAAGAQVVVWSASEDGSDFVAERIVIQPMTDTATDDAAPAEEQATDDSGATSTTDA